MTHEEESKERRQLSNGSSFLVGCPFASLRSFFPFCTFVTNEETSGCFVFCTTMQQHVVRGTIFSFLRVLPSRTLFVFSTVATATLSSSGLRWNICCCAAVCGRRFSFSGSFLFRSSHVYIVFFNVRAILSTSGLRWSCCCRAGCFPFSGSFTTILVRAVYFCRDEGTISTSGFL
jgi:hypothetical protein